MEKGEMNESIKQELKETFNLFDTNHDGKVSTKEIATIMRALGMLISEEEMSGLLHRLDTDGNGTVEFAEFESFMTQREILQKLPDETDQNMADAFQILDKNGDGYIDKEELKYYMTKFGDKMSEQDANDMIKEADKNGDGKIDYKEYVKHMSGKL